MLFPVAATEEIWSLGTDLELWRALLFALASVCFLAAFIYVLHGHAEFPATRKAFLQRFTAARCRPTRSFARPGDRIEVDYSGCVSCQLRRHYGR